MPSVVVTGALVCLTVWGWSFAYPAKPSETNEDGPRLQLIAPGGAPSQAFVEVSGLSASFIGDLRTASRTWSDEEWSRLLRVSLYQEQPVADRIPAVVGRYRLVGESLRFQPLFGLDAGRRYRVRFDPRSLTGHTAGTVETTEAILSLPKADVAPSTVVDAIYPSSETLPENQLKMYIHFSAPMRMGDGLPFIKLVDSTGQEVVDPFLPLGGEFWDRERRRYTVFFDPGRVKRGILPHEELGRPLREGREYVLIVDGSWRDAEGNPLKAPFRKAFRVGPPDETPLDPTTWSLALPRPSSREALVVDFGEPLDHGLMSRALGVEAEDGRPLRGDIEILENETKWAFTPDEPWRQGRYRLVAMSILEDLAGNQIGQRFEVDAFDRVEQPDEGGIYRVPFTVVE